MGNLTKNFSSKEFVVSVTFPALANEISVTVSDKIKFFMLASTILQPVRNEFKKPIKISSGKRNKLLNLVVGGVPSSDHRYRNYSAACDWDFVNDHTNEMLWGAYNWIIKNCNYAFGQLIIYLGDKGPRFIHVSLPKPGKISETLVKRANGKYVTYSQWLKENR
jgi:hypothetical protein